MIIGPSTGIIPGRTAQAPSVITPIVRGWGRAKKPDTGAGNIAVPIHEDTEVGDRLLLIQARMGSSSSTPDEYSGATTLLDTDGVTTGSENVHLRVSWIDADAGMLSAGYLSLNVGNYGIAIILTFDGNEVGFVTADPTPGDSDNWVAGTTATDTSGTWPDIEGLAGDLAMAIPYPKPYGSAAATGWDVLVQSMPNSGVVFQGNPAVLTKVLSTDSEMIGSGPYSWDNPGSLAATSLLARYAP